MGCSTERTIEKVPDNNRGLPSCRLTISLTNEVDSLMPYNSKKLLLGGNDELQIFDLDSKNITTISKEHKGRINSLIKLKDNKIASASADNTIKIWDIEKKECLNTLEGHSSMLWDIKYIPDDKIISGADDNTSRLWNLKDNSSILFYKSKRQISSIAILSNNKILLSSGKNILLYNLDTKEQITFLELTVWTLKALKNGDVAAGGKNLYILKITDEIKIKTEFVKGHNSTISGIIELGNESLVTHSDDKELILWDRTDPESIYLIEGHQDSVTALCLIEGNKFASVSMDKTLKIWE